jgi:hypothetical protein
LHQRRGSVIKKHQLSQVDSTGRTRTALHADRKGTHFLPRVTPSFFVETVVPLVRRRVYYLHSLLLRQGDPVFRVGDAPVIIGDLLRVFMVSQQPVEVAIDLEELLVSATGTGKHSCPASTSAVFGRHFFKDKLFD